MEPARADLAPARRARAAFYTAKTDRRPLRQPHRPGGIQTVIATTRLAARVTRISPNRNSYELVGLTFTGRADYPVCAPRPVIT